MGVVLLLLGANAPGYAQEHADADKPQHEQKKAKGQKADGQKAQGQRANPQGQRAQGQNAQPRQPAARSQPQDQNQPPQEHAQPRPEVNRRQPQVNEPAQQRRPVQQAERSTVWQQHRATNWQSQHRTWQERGGYRGYRIPDDRYRVYFGQNHGFRINTLPLVMVGGYPGFQYGGFWFSVIDPWPEYWSGDWYDNDDVYIDYSGDGYYLYNRRYPRDRLAISVYVR